MENEYEYGKWYKVSKSPKPQNRGSIYFVTKDGRKYAGTFIISQFLSLDEEIFETYQVEKWIIRDRKINKSKQNDLTYKGEQIRIENRQDLGFHWRASYVNNDKTNYINKESRQEAIAEIKN